MCVYMLCLLLLAASLLRAASALRRNHVYDEAGDPFPEREPLLVAVFHAVIKVIKFVGGRMVTPVVVNAQGVCAHPEGGSMSDKLLPWFEYHPVSLLLIAESMLDGVCSCNCPSCGALRTEFLLLWGVQTSPGSSPRALGSP